MMVEIERVFSFKVPHLDVFDAVDGAKKQKKQIRQIGVGAWVSGSDFYDILSHHRVR